MGALGFFAILRVFCIGVALLPVGQYALWLFCHFARLLRWRRHSGGGNVRCSICSKFKANYGPEEFASRDTIVGDECWFSKRVQCAKDAALGLV